jgi:hypothetical protein
MLEKLDVLATIVSILIWMYTTFPISQKIKSDGDDLVSFKSDYIRFFFKH